MVIETILIFIILFAVIVFVHELGHFLVAKRVGIGVEEFAFGFPPRLFGIKRGETLYAINLIPLGGYVKMVGEDAESDDPRAFTRQSALARGLVVIAGVVMNIILAWLVLSFLLILPNHYKNNATLFVAQIQNGSAAEKADLRIGDSILSINDQQLKDPPELGEFTRSHKGQKVIIQIRRNGSEQKKEVDLGTGEAPLGVGANSFSLAALPNPPIWKAPIIAIQMVWQVAVANFSFIGALIVGLLHLGPPAPTDQVSGPIGIYGIVAQFTALGWPYVLMAMAQLSLAIAFFNILPIPALDGGRLLFIVMDKALGRKLLSQQREALVHTLGFVLLIGLFVLVTYHDIVKLVR